jgi:putative flippase GtrA
MPPRSSDPFSVPAGPTGVHAVVGQFLRFAVTGVVATAVHVAGFAFWYEWIGLLPEPANALAFVAAFLTAYALNAHWTFGRADRAASRIVRYFGVAVVGLLLNSGIISLVVRVLGLSPYLGLAAGLVLVPPLTFWMTRTWVFRH